MKLSRRSSSQAPPSTGSVEKDDRLSGMPRMHIDYDEALSAEERSTYHQPRLLAQGEFFADVHPVARLKSVLRARNKRGR
ncbi:MAG: hypothetical protein ACXVHB_28855 [Solirubrobacteraceae bacterium]